MVQGLSACTERQNHVLQKAVQDPGNGLLHEALSQEAYVLNGE